MKTNLDFKFDLYQAFKQMNTQKLQTQVDN